MNVSCSAPRNYLDPPLLRHLLIEGAYQRVVPDEHGASIGQEQQHRLAVAGDELSFYRINTGERLPTALVSPRVEAVALNAAGADVARLRQQLRQLVDMDDVGVRSDLSTDSAIEL